MVLDRFLSRESTLILLLVPRYAWIVLTACVFLVSFVTFLSHHHLQLLVVDPNTGKPTNEPGPQFQVRLT